MTKAEEKERLAELKKAVQEAARLRKVWLARKEIPTDDVERARWNTDTEIARDRYYDALRDVFFAAGHLVSVQVTSSE